MKMLALAAFALLAASATASASLLRSSVSGKLQGKLDIIGYYGNSGDAVEYIPTLDKIDPNYNVIILTFAEIDVTGALSLDIQGPYDKNLPALKAAIPAWKSLPDPFGRRKLALISIGGQNGKWPAGSLTSAQILTGLNAFMKEYSLDGLDLDLEGDLVKEATTLVPVVEALRIAGKTVTAAPEASDTTLTDYFPLMPHLNWFAPQFYNCGPNCVGTVGPSDWKSWLIPGNGKPTALQTATSGWTYEQNGVSWWSAILTNIMSTQKLSQSQLGMLAPATMEAAGSYNNYDFTVLATQVKTSNVQHVGTWAIAYDAKNGYAFAKAMADTIAN